MYELLWYLFVAIVGGIVALKKSIVKYSVRYGAPFLTDGAPRAGY